MMNHYLELTIVVAISDIVRLPLCLYKPMNYNLNGKTGTFLNFKVLHSLKKARNFLMPSLQVYIFYVFLKIITFFCSQPQF